MSTNQQSFSDTLFNGNAGTFKVGTLSPMQKLTLRDVYPPGGFAPERRYWVDAQAMLSERLGESAPQDPGCKEDFRRLEQSLQAFLARQQAAGEEGNDEQRRQERYIESWPRVFSIENIIHHHERGNTTPL